MMHTTLFDVMHMNHLVLVRRQQTRFLEFRYLTIWQNLTSQFWLLGFDWSIGRTLVGRQLLIVIMIDYQFESLSTSKCHLIFILILLF